MSQNKQSLLLHNKNLEKQLVNFYSSDETYFSRMEKGHDEKYYEPILRILKKENAFFRKKKVLDVGSGTGTFIRVLRKVFKSSFEAVGTDISPFGRKFHKDKRIKFILADARKLPFKDESFDFVFSIDMLEHILNPQEAIEEMYRVTKKGGLILIRTRNYRSPLTTHNFLSVVELIKDLVKDKKDLSRTKRLKPIFSSCGGDKDAVSAVFADRFKVSLE